MRCGRCQLPPRHLDGTRLETSASCAASTVFQPSLLCPCSRPQIAKLVNVRYVENITDESHVERELILVKVGVGQQRDAWSRGPCMLPAACCRQLLGEQWALSHNLRLADTALHTARFCSHACPTAPPNHAAPQVHAPPGPTRTEVMQIAEIFRAHAVDTSERSLTLQTTGDVGKVRGRADGLLSRGRVDCRADQGLVTGCRCQAAARDCCCARCGERHACSTGVLSSLFPACHRLPPRRLRPSKSRWPSLG